MKSRKMTGPHAEMPVLSTLCAKYLAGGEPGHDGGTFPEDAGDARSPGGPHGPPARIAHLFFRLFRLHGPLPLDLHHQHG